MKVECIFDHDCPNIEATRAQLRKAFARINAPPQWTEWERSQPKCPPYCQHYGSPTILINGQDITGESAQADACACRVYENADGTMQGVPPLDTLVQALQTAGESAAPRSLWKRIGVLLPVIGAVLLPKLTCPACWPAYAAILSSFGISFVNYTPYLLPMTLGFLVIVVASLAYRAQTRRGYRPLGLALVGSAILLVGKFFWASNVTMYGGLVIVIAASVWNAWPTSNASTCIRCQPHPGGVT
jgi:mercuric ion transport protein